MPQDDTFNQDIADAYQQLQPYKHESHPPALLSFSAIPGSGKTTLAKKLVHDLHAQYISHDDMRDIIRQRGISIEGISMPPISRIVINRMMAEDANKLIVLDVSLDRGWKVFFDHARKLQALPIVIRLDPSLEVIRQRLVSRDGSSSQPLVELDRYKAEFDSCCRHVEADMTIGENYDYQRVLQTIKNRLLKMV